MEFSKQEYRSGLPFSSLGDLPNPGIEPTSPTFAGGFFLYHCAIWKALHSSLLLLLLSHFSRVRLCATP